jgi:hypothetical protein
MLIGGQHLCRPRRNDKDAEMSSHKYWKFSVFKGLGLRVVIVPCRTMPTPKHDPVVSCLSLSQHGTIVFRASFPLGTAQNGACFGNLDTT